LASGGGHTEIVRLLLNKGADIDARINVDGVTSLILAARFGHTEIVKLLLGKGVNAKDKKAALWEAKSMRNVKVVEILEAAGAKE
jgi:ankyrin repeat protein